MPNSLDDPARSFDGGADPEPTSPDDVRLHIDEEAVERFGHAIAAGEYAAASEILRDRWFDLLISRRQDFTAQLEAMPMASLREYPLLMMMLGVSYNFIPQRQLKGLRYFAQAALAARRADTAKRTLDPVDRALILTSECAAYRMIGQPTLGVKPAQEAVRALDALPNDRRNAVQGLSRIYSHVGITQYYAGRVDDALTTFEKGLAESPTDRYSLGFANIAMAAGIHAFRGDLPEAAAYIELAREGRWTEMQRSWYAGTFYRLAEAVVSLESFDTQTARRHLDAMVHDRRTIEHWLAIAEVEGLTELVDGRPSAGLAGVDAFSVLRGAEGRKPYALSRLAPIRALLYLASGDPHAGAGMLRHSGVPTAERHLGQARIELVLGRHGVALQQLHRVPRVHLNSRLAAEYAALETAALLRFSSGPRRGLAVAHLGELLWRTGQRLAVALLPPEDVERVSSALTDSGYADLLRGLHLRPLLTDLSSPTRLSDREVAVLRAYLDTESVPEVARELVVSVNTVKSQLRSIYRKLGVSTRDEAIAIALERNLLLPPE